MSSATQSRSNRASANSEAPATRSASRREPHGEHESPLSWLVMHNVRISGRRTTVRLKPPIWEALLDIAELQDATVDELVAYIDRTRVASNLTSAIRAFVVIHLMAAARKARSAPREPRPSNGEWGPMSTHLTRKRHRQIAKVPSLPVEQRDALNLLMTGGVALRDHPHVKRALTLCRVELPDPDPKWVLFVETDLEIDPTNIRYDATAVEALADAVEDERKRLNFDKVEILAS